ncbi:amino acid ABC transporter ATP-binding protein [Pseudomonas corrugata]
MSSLNNSTANNGVVLTVRDLKKSYGQHEVIKGIDLEVKRGEKIVICGPSGSGKSTFIRCINGLESYQSGEIKVADPKSGGFIKGLREIRREVGMVFQSFNLFPHISILDNCTLAPMSVLGLSKKEATERAELYLAKVQISPHALKYPGQLSGGQQQRAAIARALCMSPSVMLFDEPTSALDPEVVQEVLDIMCKLADDGMTMLCVTHEMGFARKVADRVIFIDEGKIIEEAPPEIFFNSSNQPRVQSFLRQISH